MADYGIFVGFGFPHPGSEQIATNLFGEFLQYLNGRAQQGAIESFEPSLLMPHGGDLGGFVLIRGEQAKLNQLFWSNEFQQFVARGSASVSNVGLVYCVFGEALQRQLAMNQQAASQ